MKNKFFNSIVSIIFIIATSSLVCAQRNKADSKVSLQFQNVVGDNPLILNENSYLNDKGEKFTLTTLNYFVSNIKLHNKNNSEYIIPQDSSYFLIKESEPESKKIMLNIPKGKYDAITFTIGVDSLRSTMDIGRRTGALDISGGMLEGMYWTWNSGYIFFKMEGNCDQMEPDRTGQKKFRYHIGGFGGYTKPGVNNIRTVTVKLSKDGFIKAQPNGESYVTIQADILKVFNAKDGASIVKNPSVMFGDFSKIISKNYAAMFSHVATVNRRP